MQELKPFSMSSFASASGLGEAGNYQFLYRDRRLFFRVCHCALIFVSERLISKMTRYI